MSCALQAQKNCDREFDSVLAIVMRFDGASSGGIEALMRLGGIAPPLSLMNARGLIS